MHNVYKETEGGGGGVLFVALPSGPQLALLPFYLLGDCNVGRGGRCADLRCVVISHLVVMTTH